MHKLRLSLILAIVVSGIVMLAPSASAVPPGAAQATSSFDYTQKFTGLSNGRGVLLSTDAGATWSDLTQDGDPHEAEFTHPDNHAIVFHPDNPFQYWEGSDGGVVRSDGGLESDTDKAGVLLFSS